MVSNKTRMKVFLLKNEYLEDDSYLKKSSSKMFNAINIGNESVNLYSSQQNVPRWYKTFFKMSDAALINSNSSGFFDKKINYDGKEYRFVISFGGADRTFELSKFIDDFGMKICLNCVDKFASISKSNIATTMSNNKEVSTKKESLGSFAFNIETDLIKGVAISPIKDNGITAGTMIGGIALSFSSTFDINNVEKLLFLLIEKYQSDIYKEKYGFIDDIKSISDNKPLEKEIQTCIVEYLNAKKYDKVWFGAPYFDEWERVTKFYVERNKDRKEYMDLYVEDIMSDFKITEFKDLSKIHVFPIYDDNEYDGYKLSECLYGEVEIDDKIYIVNNNRYYHINKDYVAKINSQYNNLKIMGTLPDKVNDVTERAYNERVSSADDDLVLFDRKIFKKGRTDFELCDLYSKKKNMFIHVKNYGASSVLSHLFFQALNSAKYFKYNKDEIIDYYKNVYDIPKNVKHSVAMAIISKDVVTDDSRINIPFFSKMSIVSTVNELKMLDIDAGVIYVSSRN